MFLNTRNKRQSIVLTHQLLYPRSALLKMIAATPRQSESASMSRAAALCLVRKLDQGQHRRRCLVGQGAWESESRAHAAIKVGRKT